MTMHIEEIPTESCRRSAARSGNQTLQVERYPLNSVVSHLHTRVMRSTSGFTLIEIMVVIIILGILVGLIVPRFMEKPEKARVVKAKLQIESISAALKEYKLDNGNYPTTDQGLQSLVEKPSIGKIPNKYPEKGYIPKIPKDPWGNQYIYISPGEHDDFDLISYGPDGEEGGEGKNADVRSWEIE